MELANLESTLQNVTKILQTPAYLPGSALIRENLSGFVDRLTDKDTPIRDRLPRKAGSGTAASWTVMTGKGVGNSPFAEGATPTEDATTYQRRAAIYKELGKTKSVSDRMLAAGYTFMDQETEQTEVAMREVIEDEEQLIITGDENNSVLEFNGLNAYITTNVTNANNNALGFTPALINAEITNILSTYGMKPTAIYISHGMKSAIDESLGSAVQVNITNGPNSTSGLTTGLDIGYHQSSVGKLPFIPTTAIADDTTTYPGFTVSDIYIVTETAKGQPVLYMEDLYPLGKQMLARTGAAISFFVAECTVLVCRMEESAARIRNVRIA